MFKTRQTVFLSVIGCRALWGTTLKGLLTILNIFRIFSLECLHNLLSLQIKVEYDVALPMRGGGGD